MEYKILGSKENYDCHKPLRHKSPVEIENCTGLQSV